MLKEPPIEEDVIAATLLLITRFKIKQKEKYSEEEIGNAKSLKKEGDKVFKQMKTEIEKLAESINEKI
jgi:hypothetical protein